MDFEVQYSSEMEAFRREVGQWLDAHVPPNSGRSLGYALHHPELQEWARQFQRQLTDQGWAAPSWPCEYGGGGLSPTHDLIVREELEARNVPCLYKTNRQVAATILACGSHQQRRRFLRSLLRGDITACRRLAYAEAVINPEIVHLQAARDGDVYVVSGEEVFWGDTAEPTHLWTLAVTDPAAPPPRRLSAFLIPADLPGSAINEQEGLVPGGERSVILEEVRVPVEYRIGAEGGGWAVAQSSSESEAEADQALKEQQALVGKLVEHCKEAVGGDQRLTQDQEMRQWVVEAYINTQVLRLISLRNRWMRSSIQEVTFHEAQYALLVKRMGPKLVSTVQDILGPYAALDDQEWALMNGEAAAFQRASLSGASSGASIPVEEHLIGICLGLHPTQKRDSQAS